MQGSPTLDKAHNENDDQSMYSESQDYEGGDRNKANGLSRSKTNKTSKLDEDILDDNLENPISEIGNGVKLNR